MTDTRRIKITMSEAMLDALQSLADEAEISISELIRRQMQVYLVTQGIELAEEVKWGGSRYPQEDDEQ